MALRMPFNRILLATAGLLVLSVLPVSPKNRLPPCPTDTNVVWDACFGTIILSDNEKYAGDHHNNLYHGWGTYYFSNGDVYVGEWRDGNRYGTGNLTYSNGAVYVGDWRDDSWNGQGTYTFRDGSRHVGEYQNGRVHGRGSFFSPPSILFPSGRLVHIGIYRDGMLVDENNLDNPVVEE